jgi:hypothetical protein
MGKSLMWRVTHCPTLAKFAAICHTLWLEGWGSKGLDIQTVRGLPGGGHETFALRNAFKVAPRQNYPWCAIYHTGFEGKNFEIVNISIMPQHRRWNRRLLRNQAINVNLRL